MKKLEPRDDEYFNKILLSDECKLSAKKQGHSFMRKKRLQKLDKKYL